MLNGGESEGLRPRPAPRRREHPHRGSGDRAVSGGFEAASGLAPAEGTIDRYRLQKWLTFIGTELHKSFSPLFNRASSDDVQLAGRESTYHRNYRFKRRSRARWPHLYKRITAGGMRGLSVIRSARPHAISVARTRGDMLAVFEIEGSP